MTHTEITEVCRHLLMFRFDPSGRHFVGLGDSGVCGSQAGHSLGAGYSMMQLGWVADAFVLDEAGHSIPLKGTLLEELRIRGAE